MSKITIELEVHEALTALGSITDRRDATAKGAEIATGDEQEILSLVSTVLGRVVTKFTDALYPDLCRWLDDEECGRPIYSTGLCRIHFDHRTKVAEILAVQA